MKKFDGDHAAVVVAFIELRTLRTFVRLWGFLRERLPLVNQIAPASNGNKGSVYAARHLSFLLLQ